MKSFAHLPRACWWVAGATLINRMGAMVFPFLVLYFHRGLGLPLEAASSVAACWGLGSFVAGPLGGWASDRMDPVRLLGFSMLGAGSLMIVFPWVRSLPWLVLCTFCLALLADLGRPSTMTALARLGGTDHGRDAFALNYMAINLGMSIGPTLGGFLAEVDYRYLFWADGTTSALSAAVLLLSGTLCPPVEKAADTPVDWNIGRRALRMYLWLSLFFWSFMTFFAAGPVYAVKWLHLSEHDVGYIWLFNTILIVLSNLWVNRITAGIALPKLLAAGCACQALCYLSLGLWPGIGGLVGATLWLTLGEMLLFSNANAYVAQVVPAEKMGRAMGINALCVSLALITSAPTMGYFFSQHSPNWLWLAMGATAGLAALGMARLPGHERPGKEPQERR